MGAIQHREKFSGINFEGFNTIGLDEINRASLMNRIDHKFLLNAGQLESILPDLSKWYSILEINNSVNHNYTSIYYDTPNFDMYLNHHNKRLNRYKIRQRIYNTSGDRFLEIKHKNNKGYTKKSRIEVNKDFQSIPYPLFDFITSNTPYHPFALNPAMSNEFYRFTLTNNVRNQRITVDTDIVFRKEEKELKLEKLVVVEVKSERQNLDRTIFSVLRKNGIHPGGMSKYSIGLAMLKPDLKQNLFKQKIHNINKICYAG